MLPIKDLAGDTHLVTNIKQITRNKKVNGEKTIQLFSIPDKHNLEGFESVGNESTTIFNDEPYVIKKISEKSVGVTSVKQADAVHTFFNTMINCQQYNLHSGSQTIFAAMTRVFENTPFDFVIVDAFLAKAFENFGRDNCLSLFKKVLDGYVAEFEIIDNTVYLYTKIGAKTDFQLRWKSNISGVDKQVNTESLATIIKGFGGKPNDSGVYPIQETYTSPNFDLFGELHADAVIDETITTVAGMQKRLKEKLIDEPQLSIKVDISEVEGDVKKEGDTGFIVYEPMNIKLEARVVELSETYKYIDGNWKVIKTDVTLANLRNKLSDITTRFSQTSKKLDRLFEGIEPLPYNVLPEAVRIAAEAINNSLTEIQYPVNGGIVLQDPDNPLIRVRLTSAGIGLSVDGGITYRTALTGRGIVTNELVAGVIRTNNIQIVGENDLFFWDGTGLYAYNANDLTKYVRLNSDGLYIAKGAMTIERPDGYVVMNNGLLQNDFSLQPTNPSFRNKVAVTEQGVYWKTTETSPVICEAYFFAHKSRYLKLRVVIHDLNSGLGSRLSIDEIGGGLLAQATRYNETDETATPFPITITVDLGVPDGAQRGIYIKLNTNTGGEARGRLMKAWMEL